MADFRGAGKSIGGVGKRKKWIILLLIVLVVLFLVKREAITQKFEEIKNNITSTVFEKKKEISEKFKKEDLAADIIYDELPSESEKISIQTADAATTLISSQGISYVAENMIDGDIATSWQDGAEDFGEGNIITLSFGDKTDVSYLVIYNGNQSSKQYYDKNNRLKKINITANKQTVAVTLDDTMDPQIIMLTGAKKCKSISIEICSVYEGTTYNDTCVAEIECYR